jgi:hypothetical protein
VDSQLPSKDALRASLCGWLKAGDEWLDRAIHMSSRQVRYHESCRCGANEEASQYDDWTLIDQWHDRHHYGDKNGDNDDEGSIEHAIHPAKVTGKLALLGLIYQIVTPRAEKPGGRCTEDPAFRYALERKFIHSVECGRAPPGADHVAFSV